MSADATSENLTFHDRLCEVVHIPGVSSVGDDIDCADGILAMPEMQAIKQALRDYVAMRSPGTLTTADTVESVMERNLRWSGLPESVARWVMQP